MSFLPSRLTLALVVACAVLIPLSVWSSWKAGVANRDKAVAERQFNRLDREVNTPGTGMRFQLAKCEAERGSLESQLEAQNKAVQALQAESAQRTAAAQQAVSVARQAQKNAEARARDILRQQPRQGESLCEAADRLILERVQ